VVVVLYRAAPEGYVVVVEEEEGGGGRVNATERGRMASLAPVMHWAVVEVMEVRVQGTPLSTTEAPLVVGVPLLLLLLTKLYPVSVTRVPPRAVPLEG
jgi:hypothetical protein